MNGLEWHTHLEIDVDGSVVATADVEQRDQPGVVRAALHVEAGHQPTGSRTRLVDAVLDLPEVHDQQHLEAALPIGETEILERLRERCDDVQTRPAGATCLVEADLPEGHRPWTARRLAIRTESRLRTTTTFRSGDRAPHGRDRPSTG